MQRPVTDISAWIHSSRRRSGEGDVATRRGELTRSDVGSPSRPNEGIRRNLVGDGRATRWGACVSRGSNAGGKAREKRLTSAESSSATTPASSFPVGVSAGLSHSTVPAHRSYCRFIGESRAIVTRVESRDHRCHVPTTRAPNGFAHQHWREWRDSSPRGVTRL